MEKIIKIPAKKTKLVRLLHNKKYRQEYGLFLVEGEKSVLELLHSDWVIDYLFVTDYFFNKYSEIIGDVPYKIVNQEKIEKIGTFKSNDSAIAIAKQKEKEDLKIDEITIVLDKIQDPGNLGTILRTADWYGIKNIIASQDSVDLYNPKVISASKGSFSRVNVYYTNLVEFLSNLDTVVIGSFLEGEDIYQFDFPQKGILVLGNESSGISEEIEKVIDKKVSINKFGKAESLNVSIATAVILDNWKRTKKHNL